MTHTAAYLSLWSLALLVGCSSPSRESRDTSSQAPQASSQGGSVVASAGDSAGSGSGWRSLFDGKTIAGWRGYRSQKVPDGWRVEDGTLTRVASGGDLMTNDTFRDFELALEWKIAPGGNSGIMYRVTEDAEKPYETGPEMQVLDDAKHPDGKSRLTSAGALYGLYPSPAGVVKPAGEWNDVRIVVKGNHVEHWLNGVKVAEAEMNSPDWNTRVAASKFKEWPGYGKAQEGHIVLQDHGDVVAYRNIRIKAL